MLYKIFLPEPHKHYLNIEFTINEVHTKELIVQIPAWRPGRYELQNFAANVRSLFAYDNNGKQLHLEKISRNAWKIYTSGISDITVKYDYYACRMDAGGCWLDEDQLYLNFIGCLMYAKDSESEACQVFLDLPLSYEIACGLPQKNNILYADDFYQLVDSPMIASGHLLHKTYSVADTVFNIWVQGEFQLDWEKLLSDFTKFTETQLSLMKDFPEKDYHFLLQLLPYKHYHGVEHRNSTVITLGPAENINYQDLVGISSHELFHAWNIIKIRPAEMLPYDFSKENYFRTGFVAEGFTTYYGDLFLVRSGVISADEYFEELNTTFSRHFENTGNYHLSLADSSFDLWVDGYTGGIPDRKVSIYVKGSVAALVLDLEIRKASLGKKSLDDLMQQLWQEFGKKKKGYRLEDIIHAVKNISGSSLRNYFDECIDGMTDLRERLSGLLPYVGCNLEISESESSLENNYGVKLVKKDSKTFIESIQAGSPADKVLHRDDVIEMEYSEIMRLGHEITTFEISIMRYGKKKYVTLVPDGKKYFQKIKIIKDNAADADSKINFSSWTGQVF